MSWFLLLQPIKVLFALLYFTLLLIITLNHARSAIIIIIIIINYVVVIVIDYILRISVHYYQLCCSYYHLLYYAHQRPCCMCTLSIALLCDTLNLSFCSHLYQFIFLLLLTSVSLFYVLLLFPPQLVPFGKTENVFEEILKKKNLIKILIKPKMIGLCTTNLWMTL